MSQGYTRGIPVDTDPNLVANSNFLVPSQAAIKAYVDARIGTGGGGGGATIYTQDGSILDDRDVLLNGFYLNFAGTLQNFQLNSDGVAYIGFNTVQSGTPTSPIIYDSGKVLYISGDIQLSGNIKANTGSYSEVAVTQSFYGNGLTTVQIGIGSLVDGSFVGICPPNTYTAEGSRLYWDHIRVYDNPGAPITIPPTFTTWGSIYINPADHHLSYKDINGVSYDLTLGGTGSMVYPSAGIANSTGTAWGTSYTTTGSGTVVALGTSPTINTSLVAGTASFDLVNTTATTVNFAGVATTLTVGALGTNASPATLNLRASTVNFTGNALSPTTLTLGVGAASTLKLSLFDTTVSQILFGGDAKSFALGVDDNATSSGFFFKGRNFAISGSDPSIATGVVGSAGTAHIFNEQITAVRLFNRAETVTIGGLQSIRVFGTNTTADNTGNTTLNLMIGPTASGNTKTFNIGTGGVSGHRVNVTVGNTNTDIPNSTALFYTNLTVQGNLIINGTTTTINSSTLTVDDKNIELASVAPLLGVSGTLSGTNTVTVSSTTGMISGQSITGLTGPGTFGVGAKILNILSSTQFTTTVNHIATGAATFNVGGPDAYTANGGGITILGGASGDKKLFWEDGVSLTQWTSTENFNLQTGKVYRINNTDVLSNDTLGANIVNSSLTKLSQTLHTGTGSVFLTIDSNGTLGVDSNTYISGSVTVANGGTGRTSFTANTILYGSTSGIQELSAEGPGFVVAGGNGSAGTTSAPIYSRVNLTSTATHTLTTSGTGYTAGTYTNVTLVLNTGTAPIIAPKATVFVLGGAVTNVTLTDFGEGVYIGSVFSVPALGGTGSGATITITGASSKHVTGTLQVTSGGTGATSFSANGAVIVSGTGTSLTSTSSNSAPGFVLVGGNGAGGNSNAPIFSRVNLQSTLTFGVLAGGTGYTAGTYNNVTLVISSGTAPQVAPVVNITVSGGSVTSVIVVSPGEGVFVGSAFTCPNTSIGGTGSGWSITVASATSKHVTGIMTVSNGGTGASTFNRFAPLYGDATDSIKTVAYTSGTTFAPGNLLSTGNGASGVASAPVYSKANLDNSITYGTIVPGSGYTNGLYTNVTLTLNSGTAPTVYPTVDITITGGQVVSITPKTPGEGVYVGTSFTCATASIGGTGSGWSVPVTAATSKHITGVLPLVNGGTGNSSTASNGQLLIGNNSGGFSLATLTQGTGISITNGNGTITIGTTGGGGGTGTLTSILRGDGSGGFNSVTVGSGLAYNSTSGVLSATGGGASAAFNSGLESQIISAASDGTAVTYTIAGTPKFSVGDTVNVSGVSPAGYNTVGSGALTTPIVTKITPPIPGAPPGSTDFTGSSVNISTTPIQITSTATLSATNSPTLTLPAGANTSVIYVGRPIFSGYTATNTSSTHIAVGTFVSTYTTGSLTVTMNQNAAATGTNNVSVWTPANWANAAKIFYTTTTAHGLSVGDAVFISGMATQSFNTSSVAYVTDVISTTVFAIANIGEFTATLTASTTVNLTGTLTTKGLYVGQALIKVSGAGAFAANPRIAAITSLTQFILNTAATAGDIRFSAINANNNTASSFSLNSSTNTTHVVSVTGAARPLPENCQAVPNSGLYINQTITSTNITGGSSTVTRIPPTSSTFPSVQFTMAANGTGSGVDAAATLSSPITNSATVQIGQTPSNYTFTLGPSTQTSGSATSVSSSKVYLGTRYGIKGSYPNGVYVTYATVSVMGSGTVSGSTGTTGTVTLSTGNTNGLLPGQTITATAGTGGIGTNCRVVSITNSTAFTISATAGISDGTVTAVTVPSHDFTTGDYVSVYDTSSIFFDTSGQVLFVPSLVSTTGTVAVAGSTLTITGMSSIAGLCPGAVITATAGTGTFGTGTTIIVSSITNTTSIVATLVVSGGTAPSAGTVTNISTNNTFALVKNITSGTTGTTQGVAIRQSYSTGTMPGRTLYELNARKPIRGFRPPAGSWVSNAETLLSNTAAPSLQIPANNNIRWLTLFSFPYDFTTNAFGINIPTAGAGASYILGLYKISIDVYNPSNISAVLLTSAGATVSGTSTGIKIVSLTSSTVRIAGGEMYGMLIANSATGTAASNITIADTTSSWASISPTYNTNTSGTITSIDSIGTSFYEIGPATITSAGSIPTITTLPTQIYPSSFFPSGTRKIAPLIYFKVL